MRFFYDNVMAIQIAAVCSVLAWLFGGTISSALLPTVPWLLAILFEGMICFPQRHAGETTYEARSRVWRNLRKDPLTWLVVVFLFILAIPFFNKGLCPICDYPAINFDGHSEGAPLPFMPYCIDRLEHLNVVLWFLPALTAMLAVKHALLKRGKCALLYLLVLNGVGLSVIGFVQAVTGATGPLWSEIGGKPSYFFSTFGYPNMAGDYFTTLFGIAIALWRWDVEIERRENKERDVRDHQTHSYKAFWRKHVMMIPAVIFFFSALMTLSRSAILLSSTLAIIFFIHSFVSFVSKMKKVQRVKVTTVNLVVLIIIATFFFVFMSNDTRTQIANGKARVQAEASAEAGEPAEPSELAKVAENLQKDLKREIASVESVGVLDRLAGQGGYHNSVAMRVWIDHPFFGCGGWGYKHLCLTKMTENELKHVQEVGGVNVHNDYLQFLAEHGAVGLILFLGTILLLVWPVGKIWKALINSVRFIKPKDQPAKPITIFALPAPVFCILLTSIATMLHALGDCPFRSPAVMTLFFVTLASADGFLPKLRQSN